MKFVFIDYYIRNRGTGRNRRRLYGLALAARVQVLLVRHSRKSYSDRIRDYPDVTELPVIRTSLCSLRGRFRCSRRALGMACR